MTMSTGLLQLEELILNKLVVPIEYCHQLSGAQTLPIIKINNTQLSNPVDITPCFNNSSSSLDNNNRCIFESNNIDIINEAEWHAYIANSLNESVKSLGIEDGEKYRMSFSKLLVIKNGGEYSHHDMHKTVEQRTISSGFKKMATMIISLPTVTPPASTQQTNQYDNYGDLVVEYMDQIVSFNTCSQEDQVKFISFYSQCEWKISIPTQSKPRVYLMYYIDWNGKRNRIEDSHQLYINQIEKTRDELNILFKHENKKSINNNNNNQSNETLKKLKLDHKYTNNQEEEEDSNDDDDEDSLAEDKLEQIVYLFNLKSPIDNFQSLPEPIYQQYLLLQKAAEKANCTIALGNLNILKKEDDEIEDEDNDRDFKYKFQLADLKDQYGSSIKSIFFNPKKQIFPKSMFIKLSLINQIGASNLNMKIGGIVLLSNQYKGSFPYIKNQLDALKVLNRKIFTIGWSNKEKIVKLLIELLEKWGYLIDGSVSDQTHTLFSLVESMGYGEQMEKLATTFISAIRGQPQHTERIIQYISNFNQLDIISRLLSNWFIDAGFLESSEILSIIVTKDSLKPIVSTLLPKVINDRVVPRFSLHDDVFDKTFAAIQKLKSAFPLHIIPFQSRLNVFITQRVADMIKGNIDANDLAKVLKDLLQKHQLDNQLIFQRDINELFGNKIEATCLQILNLNLTNGDETSKQFFKETIESIVPLVGLYGLYPNIIEKKWLVNLTKEIFQKFYLVDINMDMFIKLWDLVANNVVDKEFGAIYLDCFTNQEYHNQRPTLVFKMGEMLIQQYKSNNEITKNQLFQSVYTIIVSKLLYIVKIIPKGLKKKSPDQTEEKTDWRMSTMVECKKECKKCTQINAFCRSKQEHIVLVIKENPDSCDFADIKQNLVSLGYKVTQESKKSKYMIQKNTNQKNFEEKRYTSAINTLVSLVEVNFSQKETPNKLKELVKEMKLAINECPKHVKIGNSTYSSDTIIKNEPKQKKSQKHQQQPTELPQRKYIKNK